MSPRFEDAAGKEPRPPKQDGVSLPVVPVVAGITIEGGKVLVTRRLPQDRFPLLWEFPGGKVEPGETHAQALIRELIEEIDVQVIVGPLYDRLSHESDLGVTLEIFFYFARRSRGEPRPIEVMEWRWAGPAELRRLDFIPSNQPVVNRLAEDLEKGRAPELDGGSESDEST